MVHQGDESNGHRSEGSIKRLLRFSNGPRGRQGILVLSLGRGQHIDLLKLCTIYCTAERSQNFRTNETGTLCVYLENVHFKCKCALFCEDKLPQVQRKGVYASYSDARCFKCIRQRWTNVLLRLPDCIGLQPNDVGIQLRGTTRPIKPIVASSTNSFSKYTRVT